MNTVKNKTKNVIRIFSTIALLIVGELVIASCSDDDENTETTRKPPVVLVHGAWQASYAWEQVRVKLVAEGYEVRSINLKGHGDDNTAVSDLSFAGYVDQVKDAVSLYHEPVILIGHSLGGAVITQAASEIPTKIQKLVYVAGFIPQSGKSVFDYAGLDTASLLGPVLEFNADHTLAGLTNPQVNLPKVFVQDGTDGQKQIVLNHYKVEPVIPLATPLNYTAETYAAAGKKYYVFTTGDNAISFPFQQKMATEAGIEKTYKIASGHSPFISKPDDLTIIIKNIVKD